MDKKNEAGRKDEGEVNFFFVCEIMRDILQAGVLLATAFSDILCFDVPKCCVASNYTMAPNIFCL